ncbi:class II fructose-bisphosphate aldolase [Streptomyces sp. NPDC005146]
MPIMSTAAIVAAARTEGRGVAAFNVIQIEHIEAVAEAAERSAVPVIVQISENAVHYHRGRPAPIAAAAAAIADSSSAPLALHLDHATDRDLVARAADLGFSSVMYDASALGYHDNVAATAEMAEHCHARGLWVEAELGEIGGKDGVHAPGARTDPAQAAEYVRATAVDGLAVAVGTSHAMLDQNAVLDFDLIAALRAQVPVPLVLHGSSGVADAGLTRAVAGGITKVNIGTQLNKVFTHAVRTALGGQPTLVDPRRYLGPGRDAIAAEATRLIHILQKG